MPARHGEAQATGTIAVARVARRLHDLLLERGARALGIAVEGDERLGQLVVAQPRLAQQGGDDGAQIAGGDRLVEVQPAGRQLAPQLLGEREIAQVAAEAHQVGGRGVAAGGAALGLGEPQRPLLGEGRPERREHARGRPGGGHEERQASVGGRGGGGLEQRLVVRRLHLHDAVPQPARALEPDRRRWRGEQRELPLRLGGGDPGRLELRAVGGREERRGAHRAG